MGHPAAIRVYTCNCLDANGHPSPRIRYEPAERPWYWEDPANELELHDLSLLPISLRSIPITQLQHLDHTNRKNPRLPELSVATYIATGEPVL
jgi:hypothetical protein